MNPAILNFSRVINEKMKCKGITCMEALLEFCDETDASPSDIKELVNPAMRSLLQIEAENLNYLKKTPKLFV